MLKKGGDRNDDNNKKVLANVGSTVKDDTQTQKGEVVP
jgi:hypothetical protein